MKKNLFLALLTLFATTFANDMYSNLDKPTNHKVYDSSIDDSDLFKKDDRAVFVNGEFLYWTLEATDLQYAFDYNRPVANPPATSFGLGEYKTAKYSWDPGFRVSLGWFNAPNYWQLYGQFTWMRIRGNDAIERNSSIEPIVATFHQDPLSNTITKASSRLKTTLDLGDLLISRVFVTNPHLRLRVLGGLTLGKIKQSWNIFYTAEDMEKISNRYRFFGGGFRVGLTFDWFWGKDYYITGKTSAASLIGKYKYDSNIATSNNNVYYQDSRAKEYRGVYNIQFLLGPSYQRSFCNNRLEIFAGYELNSWFNVHQVTQNSSVSSITTNAVVPTVNRGTMMFQGLTTRLTVDF